MSSSDAPPRRTSRSRASSTVGNTQCVHPSATSVDVNTAISIEDLTQLYGEGRSAARDRFEVHADFVNVSDETLQLLFVSSARDNRSTKETIFPPPTYRRDAKKIRDWFDLGNRQRQTMLAEVDENLEVVPSPTDCTLCWNGNSWEERVVDGGENTGTGPSSVQQHPMADEGRVGCPGVTLDYIQHHHSVSKERAERISLGFKHACRESLTTRARLSHPENNQYHHAPPTIGVLCDGNNTSQEKWTVEEHAHPPEDDNYNHLSIHAMACSKETFVVGDDPAAKPICAGCIAAKKRLFERFDQNVKARETQFKPQTRRIIMEKSGSLQKQHTDYFQRESKKKGQKIARRDTIINNYSEQTGVQIKVNKASDAIFNESVADAVGKYLEKKLSKDSIAELAFRQSVETHRIACDKGAQAVRHSSLMIRLGALTLQSMGLKGGLFDLVAKIAGFPSSRQLRRYTVSNSNDPDGIMHDNCKRARDIFNGMFPDADPDAYERHCALAFDGMKVKARFGVGRNTNEIVGIDNHAFDEDVILRELKELEAEEESTDGDGTKLGIANNFLVFIATTWTSKGKICFLAARYGKKSVTAPFLVRTLRECILALAFYGFIVDTLAGDGASENRATFKLLATISARDILRTIYSEEELKGLPLDFKIGFRHPHRRYRDKVTIVIGGEMPHWVKKFRNAFDNESRTLMFEGKEMALDPIYQVWLVSGDATASGDMRQYHFTHDHYMLNAYLKMRVFLAIQIPSQTTIRMLRVHCEKERPESLAYATLNVSDLDGPSESAVSRDIEDYKPMIKLFEKVDRLVDIVNGQDYKKGKKRDIQLLNHPKHRHIKELFDVLRTFEDWREECGGFNNKFITRQTWEDLVWLVFGYAAHAALYLKEDGSNVMNQGRGGSDCCEHLFGKCRYINSNPTMQQARECASKVSGALGMHSRAFMVDSKGNSGTASTETTAEDLLQPLETTKKRKRTGD